MCLGHSLTNVLKNYGKIIIKHFIKKKTFSQNWNGSSIIIQFKNTKIKKKIKGNFNSFMGSQNIVNIEGTT